MMNKYIEKLPMPEQMRDERYFQIRETSKNDGSHFYIFCVQPCATDKEIGDIAAEIWTNENINRKTRTLINHKWKKIVPVIEVNRIIKKLAKPTKSGRTYENCWTTKRGGLKLKIENSHLKMTMVNGNVYEGNGYKYFPLSGSA